MGSYVRSLEALRRAGGRGRRMCSTNTNGGAFRQAVQDLERNPQAYKEVVSYVNTKLVVDYLTKLQPQNNELKKLAQLENDGSILLYVDNNSVPGKNTSVYSNYMLGKVNHFLEGDTIKVEIGSEGAILCEGLVRYKGPTYTVIETDKGFLNVFNSEFVKESHRVYVTKIGAKRLELGWGKRPWWKRIGGMFAFH